MANRKKQYIDLKGETASNWDVVVLLSLTEIADKVLRESRLPRVEWRPGVAALHATCVGRIGFWNFCVSHGALKIDRLVRFSPAER